MNRGWCDVYFALLLWNYVCVCHRKVRILLPGKALCRCSWQLCCGIALLCIVGMLISVSSKKFRAIYLMLTFQKKISFAQYFQNVVNVFFGRSKLNK